ncbi:MAG: hypothetical protein LBJ67_18410 [Planctomycetaceae bacterium]|jgi:hypothetical protein|nr:hypothetical protein [Planctomycetaceae bacterium]
MLRMSYRNYSAAPTQSIRTERLNSYPKDLTIAALIYQVSFSSRLLLLVAEILLLPTRVPLNSTEIALVQRIFRVLRIAKTANSPRHCPQSLETKGLRDELKFLRINTSLLMISSALKVPTLPVVPLKHEAD